MTIKVTGTYIDTAIVELYSSLGIRESVDCGSEFDLIRKGKLLEAITSISNYIGLPVKYNLEYVSDKYNDKQNNGPLFSSDDLVKRDNSGKTSTGIVAQVLLPTSLPSYGSSRLKDFPITVRISNHSLKHPNTLIALLVHEMSHILLNTIFHKEMHNEVYVDLTGMILGFNEVIKKGRKIEAQTHSNNMVHTNTTTYGYLNDEMFDYAYNMITKKLEENISIKINLQGRANKFECLIENVERLIFQHENYLSYIKDRKYKQFDPIESKIIVDLYANNYIGELKRSINDMKEKIKNIIKETDQIRKYNTKVIGILDANVASISRSIVYVEKRQVELVRFNNILKKHVGLIFRIKLNYFN